MSMGDGDRTEIGKYLDIAAADEMQKFTQACRRKVNHIYFCGCNVGKGTVGTEFIQKVADESRASVHAPNCECYWGIRVFWEWRADDYAEEEGGAWKTAHPTSDP